MQAVVNGLLTHYQQTGTGQTVLLLHGWGDNSQGLAALQKDLSRQYSVVSVDLPGFGASQPPQTGWNLDDYAEFTQAFLDKIGCNDVYAVIGHSNGGALAIRAVALKRLKAKKLVLLAASGIRTSQKTKRVVLKVIAKVGNLATLWLPERYRQGLRKSLYGVAGSDALVVPAMKETFRRTVRQDVQRDAAQLTIPTLLVYAENDRAVPLQDGETYQKLIKNSKLVTVADAAHFVHIDQPDQVATAVKDFLA
jgi:pimeloyl-ACP methyl ester carboxylesterase